jgi:hypothetical protein
MQERIILTLEQLADAAREHKAVYFPNSTRLNAAWPFTRPVPAAVMLQQSGERLLRYFAAGMYIYVKGVTIHDPGTNK